MNPKVLLAIIVAIAGCKALPVWINGFEYPFIYRAPSMAVGFGSGFSSNINGIRHSSGIGAAFSNGGGQAYGMGVGAGDSATGLGVAYSNGGHAFGAGESASIGASATPYFPIYFTPQKYQSSMALTQNGLQYGTAVSENGRNHQLASASNFGNGLSTANSVSSGNYQSTSALASSIGAGSGYSSSISAAQNLGGVRSALAHTTQYHQGTLQHSGATAIDAPGLQSADAHAVRVGY